MKTSAILRQTFSELPLGWPYEVRSKGGGRNDVHKPSSWSVRSPCGPLGLLHMRFCPYLAIDAIGMDGVWFFDNL
jgi:hypothetical protein